MKKLFMFFVATMFATIGFAQKKYDCHWEKIDSIDSIYVANTIITEYNYGNLAFAKDLNDPSIPKDDISNGNVYVYMKHNKGHKDDSLCFCYVDDKGNYKYYDSIYIGINGYVYYLKKNDTITAINNVITVDENYKVITKDGVRIMKNGKIYTTSGQQIK